MDTIGGFVLKNSGWFLCNGRLRYFDSETGQTVDSALFGRLAINQSEVIRPVMEPAPRQLLSLSIHVLWGRDRDCGSYFKYDAASTDFASYEIKGTTFVSELIFHGFVKEP